MTHVHCPPPGSSQQYLGQEEYYGGEQYGHSQAASEPMSQQYYPDGEARSHTVGQPRGTVWLLTAALCPSPDLRQQSTQRPLAGVCLGMRVRACLPVGRVWSPWRSFRHRPQLPTYWRLSVSLPKRQ